MLLLVYSSKYISPTASRTVYIPELFQMTEDK